MSLLITLTDVNKKFAIWFALAIARHWLFNLQHAGDKERYVKDAIIILHPNGLIGLETRM